MGKSQLIIECFAPKNKAQWRQYYHFRWQILRAPWQQPQGSEQDELEDQAIHRMLVNEKGDILGVARLHFTSQYQAQIRYTAVRENVRGQGLGKRLIGELEHQALLRGAHSIYLNAREFAIRFYEDLGYQLGGLSHVLYDQLKHFTMNKQLTVLPKNNVTVIDALQEKWFKTIPVSQAMNIAICYYDGVTIISHCDPAFNKNLHNTMFAGSIYTLATLTGWGWIYLYLLERNLQGNIVLANASIKYVAPINGIVAAKTSEELVDVKLNSIKPSKKIRIRVSVKVLSGDNVAALFSGDYVVTQPECSMENKEQ